MLNQKWKVADICTHPFISQPYFNPERAATMTPEEVHARYPRGCETCSECGEIVISYASIEHRRALE